MRTRLFLLLATVAVVAVGGISWLRSDRNDLEVLPVRPGMTWIRYPCPGRPNPQAVLPRIAKFRRDFTAPDARDGEVTLQISALGSGTVRINDRVVKLEEDLCPARVIVAEVAGFVLSGENRLEVEVSRDSGPPLLSLSLVGRGFDVSSDEGWLATLNGATELSAVRATDVPAWHFADTDTAPTPTSVLGALAVSWPMLLIEAFVVLVALVFVTRIRRRCLAEDRPVPIRAVLPIFGLVSILWILLFLNNVGELSGEVGFDAKGHIDYILYVQEKGKLPFADEGWSMFHPPLYYVAASAVTSLFGTTVRDDAGISVVRWFGLACGIAQIWFVFLSVRAFFPGSFSKQAFGLILAGFVPVHLVVFQYVTNEVLSGLFGAMAVYLCLRLLNARDVAGGPRVRACGLIGFALGMGLLAKLTAVLIIPAAAVAVFSVRSRGRRWVPGIQNLMVVLFVCLLVCGWHYVRVWNHFGKPVVGNWEAGIGVPWWQFPGYRGWVDFLRFGRVLSEPLMAGMSGVADGFYSTLWGDGLIGGRVALWERPPWNLAEMISGYALAIIPSVLITVGAGSVFIDWLKTGRAVLFFLLVLMASALGAFLLMTLKVPSYAQIKAFYLLPVSSVLAILGARGLGIGWRVPRWVVLGLWTLLGVWAANSYLSFWIRSDNPTIAAIDARMCLVEDGIDRAEERLREIDAFESADMEARYAWALVRIRQGAFDEAAEALSLVVESHPDHGEAWANLVFCLETLGSSNQALGIAQRGVKSAEHPDLFFALAILLDREGERAAAIAAARRGLFLQPTLPRGHTILAELYRQSGAEVEALFHEGFVRNAVNRRR